VAESGSLLPNLSSGTIDLMTRKEGSRVGHISAALREQHSEQFASGWHSLLHFLQGHATAGEIVSKLLSPHSSWYELSLIADTSSVLRATSPSRSCRSRPRSCGCGPLPPSGGPASLQQRRRRRRWRWRHRQHGGGAPLS